MELTPRQAELADAALRILARGGMAAVSFRSVATESGWSLGAVQKAFPTKEALDRAVFARLREAGGGPPPGEPGRPTLESWLVELLMGMLPLTQAARDATLQGAAFAERAAFDASIGRAIAASDAELRGRLSMLVRRAQHEGELRSTIEPSAVAYGVMALAQGMASQLLYDEQPPDVVRGHARSLVAALLGTTTGAVAAPHTGGPGA